MSPEQEKHLAKTALRLAHQEVNNFKGILSDYGDPLPVNRENVIQCALQYAHSYKLQRPAVEDALDHWKTKRGFGKFKAL